MNYVGCVTGGAQGIGLAIATGLIEMDWRIVIVDLLKETEGKQILKGLKGKVHLYLSADISSGKDRERIASAIRKKYKRIDLLINNAGIAPKERKDILDMSEESYDRVTSVNLKGPFFLTQLIARYMIELLKKGTVNNPKIINISSISAYTSSTSRGEYCLSKAGISMMTKLYADRLAGFGINVYEIRPGIIKTKMTEAVQEKYENLIKKEGLLPIRRWGDPEDIAEAVKAIISGAFDYSTGEVFNIDGGFHLRRL